MNEDLNYSVWSSPNGPDFGDDEVQDIAIKKTVERADKFYDAFVKKGYNNDTAADWTKELIPAIYAHACTSAYNTVCKKYNMGGYQNGTTAK